MSEKLPKVLAELKRVRAEKKKLDTEEKKLNPLAKDMLKKSGNSIPGAKLITSERIEVKNELAMEWAKKNLKPDEYKTLFVRMFDSNAFVDLVRKLRKEQIRKTPKGQKPKRLLPKGIINVNVTESVRF